MGLPRPPAFLDPSLSEDVILENGVNFASGGGGILNETGGLFVSYIYIYKQNYFFFLFVMINGHLICLFIGTKVFTEQAN